MAMTKSEFYRWLHDKEFFTQPQQVFKVDKQKYLKAMPVYSTASINSGRE